MPATIPTRPKAAGGARVADESTEPEAAAQVRRLFDSIAPTYDRLNHLLSFGLDRWWWAKAARAFQPVLQNPHAKVLDLCCGTGDMTAALLARRPQNGEPLTGLDFSPEMLDRARGKFATKPIVWVEGDAMHLPFADASFDLVTAAFGFRNLSNYAAGLAEIRRVLRPGGQIGILEANQPEGWRALLYNVYFRHLLPVVGGMISGDRAAYRYLPASVERFPRPPQMLELLSAAGLEHPAWDGYLLRAAGLYRATKA